MVVYSGNFDFKQLFTSGTCMQDIDFTLFEFGITPYHYLHTVLFVHAGVVLFSKQNHENLIPIQ